MKGSILGVVFFGALAGMLALDRYFGVPSVIPWHINKPSELQLFLIVGTVVYPLALLTMVSALMEKVTLSRARLWPQTHGKVVSIETDVTLGRGAHYWARYAYGYAVNGKNYDGTVSTRFHGGLLNQADDADAYKASHPVGRPIEIRYNPARPSSSVVFDAHQPADRCWAWAMLSLSIPLAAFIPEVRAFIVY